MFTSALPMFTCPWWSAPDPADRTARFEVGVVRSARVSSSTTIYLTKYHGREVGDRSVGMTVDAAEAVAEALLRAVRRERSHDEEGRL